MKNYAELHDAFLKKIKENLPELEKVLEDINGHWVYEDLIYRFYHQSYKVFYIQGCTTKIVEVLAKLKIEGYEQLDDFYTKILLEGTKKQFDSKKSNQNWLEETRPMLEAFFHSKYFLEMAVKYGKELEKAPECMPSGWAGLLYLYNLR